VVRTSTLKRQGPASGQTIYAISQKLTIPVIQGLNSQVAVQHHSAASVARAWLAQQGLR
jgi:glycine betaine/choline ABC-type transport system substrate-binding protein